VAVEDGSAERAQRTLEAVMAHVSDQIFVIGSDGRFRWASPSAAALFGVEHWAGREVGAFVHPDDLPAVQQELGAMLEGRLAGPVNHLFRVWSDPRKEWRWVEVAASDHRDDPALEGVLVCSRDVTERVAQAEAFREQALHDALTGLPNRALLLDRITTAALRARRAGTDLAVLFFDLDHFKQVNDTLGHAAGDRLLVAVTDRVRARLRAQDTFGRLGGDEFVIVLEGLERPSEAAVASVCDDLVAALAKPIQVDGHQLRVTSSVGVAVSSGSDAPRSCCGRPTSPCM